MAWIESHESLPTHPKTKRLCRLLKISPIVAVGHLHFLWWWAMNHAQDGSLSRYTADDIADACEWLDDSQTFYNALIQSGFIDESEQGYIIHDWFDYAGKLIALRQKDAERKRNSRGKKNESASSPEDVRGTSEGGSTESICNPNPNPNPNQNKDLKDTTSTNIYSIYQNSIGMMNGTVKQLIDDDIALYTEPWVEEAIKESVRQNKNSYSYIQGILKRWKRDGKNTGGQAQHTNKSPDEYIPDPTILRMLREAN